jgi:hypothetical protein
LIVEVTLLLAIKYEKPQQKLPEARCILEKRLNILPEPSLISVTLAVRQINVRKDY